MGLFLAAAIAAGGAVALVVAVAVGRYVYCLSGTDPNLRGVRLILPQSLRGMRSLERDRSWSALPSPAAEGVTTATVEVPRASGGHVTILHHDVAGRTNVEGAVLWMHGGGYVSGSAAGWTAPATFLAASLGAPVFSVEYRLAPEDPFPSALEDCLLALRWLHDHADSLAIDPARIAVGGASSGGGLAAAVCQAARDRGGPPIAFQVLRYPMLDDRTTLTRQRARGRVVWTARSNRFGWTSYLGRRPSAASPPPYAVPARTEDLAGLPPAWIGVGDVDLFCAESVSYAERLASAGVPVELHVMPGLYHVADVLVPNAPVVRDFLQLEVDALRRRLRG